MSVADERKRGDVRMVREHMDGIPRTPFPPGYGARAMTLADIGQWTAIQRDAEQYIDIADTLFTEQFGDDPRVIAERCFIVTDPSGSGVGTISAWFDPDMHGMEWGRLHWLAIRPVCQGKGLGRAALSFAMAELAKRHDRAYLDTDIRRVAAVKLYLDFGFTPDLRGPGAETAWAACARVLEHPALRAFLDAQAQVDRRDRGSSREAQ